MGILITNHHEKGWIIRIREKLFICYECDARKVAMFLINNGVEIKLSEDKRKYTVIDIEQKEIVIGKDYDKMVNTLGEVLKIKQKYGYNPEISFK